MNAAAAAINENSSRSLSQSTRTHRSAVGQAQRACLRGTDRTDDRRLHLSPQHSIRLRQLISFLTGLRWLALVLLFVLVSTTLCEELSHQLLCVVSQLGGVVVV